MWVPKEIGSTSEQLKRRGEAWDLSWGPHVLPSVHLKPLKTLVNSCQMFFLTTLRRFVKFFLLLLSSQSLCSCSVHLSPP